MADPQTPPSPDDQSSDPNRDRDKPRHPAPPGAGESGTAHNPVGAEGPPASGAQPEPTAPVEAPSPPKP